MFKNNIAILLIISLFTASCAGNIEGSRTRDPFESINRKIFTFNEKLDDFALRPITKAYRWVIPEYGRQRVTNILSNLNQPIIFANSLLQADGENAFSSLWSFILNTTLGIGGIFDFTGENTNLIVRKEDFGQTLGKWGVGTGAYIVLPLFGASNFRDTIGLIADTAIDPFNYVDNDLVTVRSVAKIINARSNNWDLLEEIYENSFDPYATIRSGYLQKRAAQVKNTHKYISEK